MYSRQFRLLALASLFFFASGCVSAMYTMSMTITPPSYRDSTNSTMGILLVNLGDETAYKGTVQIMHPANLKADPVSFSVLAPNVTNDKEVEVAAEGSMRQGTYPLVTSLEFMDGNNYPIYMIFETRFDVGKPSSTKVLGTLSDTKLPADGKGKMTLKVKNMDEAPHTVKTRLFLPASITADKTEEDIQVGPQEEATVDYEISNFMALQDSNFMAIATMEYDDETHHASTSRGRVRILPSAEGMSPLILPAAAVVLIIAGYGYLKFGSVDGMKKWLLRPKKGRK